MDIRKLEDWYQKHHRKLSFRMTQNPYHIWVSEVMLQQTQVDTVLPYFERFIQKYPTIDELAIADEETLHKDVEGLGYYRRFKNMHLAAKYIKDHHQGIFPKTYEEVIALPGIGKYTAGAIMSIAYNKPYSALDGNVIRVLSRYLGNPHDMREEKNKKVLDQYNQQQIERSTPEVYTQAMMELGAILCRPKNPKCEECPLNTSCFAYQRNEMQSYPYLSRLKEKKNEFYITLIIHHNEGVYVRKRTETLLNGMYEYPQFEFESIASVVQFLEEKGITLVFHGESSTYQHIFTHKIWHMIVCHVSLVGKPDSDWIWITIKDLDNIPMSIAHRKISIFK